MENNQAPKVTRKQFLKLLAAAGGATAAAAFLPGKWVKPIVKVGVLPAHAQSSDGVITITRLNINRGGIVLNIQKGRGLASPVKYSPLSAAPNYHASFHYDDTAGGVTDSATLYLTADNGSHTLTLVDGKTFTFQGGHAGGDPSVGNGLFYFVVPEHFYGCGSNSNGAMGTLYMMVGSRSSNTDSDSFPSYECP
jgi:hypothetical protein